MRKKIKISKVYCSQLWYAFTITPFYVLIFSSPIFTVTSLNIFLLFRSQQNVLSITLLTITNLLLLLELSQELLDSLPIQITIVLIIHSSFLSHYFPIPAVSHNITKTSTTLFVLLTLSISTSTASTCCWVFYLLGQTWSCDNFWLFTSSIFVLGTRFLVSLFSLNLSSSCLLFL